MLMNEKWKFYTLLYNIGYIIYKNKIYTLTTYNKYNIFFSTI